ncbi:ROK family transcriptional regulator [Cohnella endophytica]|uniref:ROK family transcriptional regulator n=1 Tax=Cohnella endophytica TaxID=2419778 RepID=A0A494XDE7_9BACL|nr:ROK family transcriptional regulator [Cohnella endophytica]RKP48817.1 ROK family transcriptional regulator [Cohnella endophytica]
MTTPTGDQALIKRINTAIVLESILRNAPLSRAQISEQSGLNKATVSSLVQDLIDGSLVREIGTGQSSGGRKPVMLDFVSSSGYAIGIDLGVNYIRGVLADLRGNVVAERTSSLRLGDAGGEAGVSIAVDQLCGCIESLMTEAPASAYGIVGIGVGVPGLVDDGGTLLLAPNLKWRDVPLQRILTDKFSLPVTIDNEANMGALGEQKYGAGRSIGNIIYVSVGIGIGTGLILNKSLYKGASGFSGEMGHLSVEAHGKSCTCGNRGCWEMYASEQALLEQASPLGFDDLESLLAAAGEGRADVLELFAGIGEYLGIGIANIVNVFNPDAVVIGNRMSQARPWLEDVLRRTVVQRALGFHLRKVQLLFAELGERSTMMGAAEMAIEGFFARVKAT